MYKPIILKNFITVTKLLSPLNAVINTLATTSRYRFIFKAYLIFLYSYTILIFHVQLFITLHQKMHIMTFRIVQGDIYCTSIQ